MQEGKFLLFLGIISTLLQKGSNYRLRDVFDKSCLDYEKWEAARGRTVSKWLTKKILTSYYFLNGDKINLDKALQSDSLEYSFEEDIIDELKDEFLELKQSIEQLRKIDLETTDINEVVFLNDYVEGIGRLYRVLGELRVTLKDLQDFDLVISKSLPDGPNDDSELV